MIPPDAESPALRFGVDRLAVAGRRFFGWGWAAHRADAVTEVALRVAGEGWERRVAANYGLARHDVGEAFPDYPYARSSGFMITGYLPRTPARSLTLEITVGSGAPSAFEVTKLVESGISARTQANRFRRLARSAWRHARKGEFAALFRKAGAQRLVATTLDDERVSGELASRLREFPGACLVLDHDMGGGANQYRRALVAERLAAGQAVLECIYHLPALEYRLQWCRPGMPDESFRASSFLVLEAAVEDGHVAEIFVNSVVSFDEPLALAQWLAGVRASHPRVRLTVTAHDYFSVCPTYVLLNDAEKFCGIPGPAECARCLKAHRGSYLALAPPTDIGSWRSLWGACLAAASEVRCFSDSSRRLLLRAYPDLAPDRLTVIPHRLDFAPPRIPVLDHAAPLTIGIIGNLSVQKGVDVVRRLVERIDREAHDVRVVVLGKTDIAIRSPRFHEAGPYERKDLVDLIERHRINLLLFPSICPETFSYAVEEMILMKLPIVAFDLGAPGDRLRGYPLGRLSPGANADDALRTLMSFHRELGARVNAES